MQLDCKDDNWTGLCPNGEQLDSSQTLGHEDDHKGYTSSLLFPLLALIFQANFWGMYSFNKPKAVDVVLSHLCLDE